MNMNIGIELEGLFEEWKSRIKEKDSSSHFTRDGLMYNSIDQKQNEEAWHSSHKRILFLLKDQNQDGNEKWDEDIREWLIDTESDETIEKRKIKEANRNLKPRFIRNLAFLLWGLSKTDNDNPWWYDEVSKHFDEVKEFFNTQPFAMVECKKQPGGGVLENRVLNHYLEKYRDLLQREIEILSPTMIVCAGSIIYDFVIKMYPQDELICIGKEHNSIRFHAPTGTFIFCSYHPSCRKSSHVIYEGVMNHYRAYLKFQSSL